MSDTLLTLRDVHINFPARKNWLGKTTEHVHAINGIDLQIDPLSDAGTIE